MADLTYWPLAMDDGGGQKSVAFNGTTKNAALLSFTVKQLIIMIFLARLLIIQRERWEGGPEEKQKQQLLWKILTDRI